MKANSSPAYRSLDAPLENMLDEYTPAISKRKITTGPRLARRAGLPVSLQPAI
jgi:hypothetical protein